MARTQRFERPTVWIEATNDSEGLYYLAWRPHTSRFFRDRRSLLRWVGWPIKTATGDELRAWLDLVEQTSTPAEPAIQA